MCQYLYDNFAQTVHSFNSERGKIGGGISRDNQDEKKIFFVMIVQKRGYNDKIYLDHKLDVRFPTLIVSPIDLKRPNTMATFFNKRFTWVIQSGIYDVQA